MNYKINFDNLVRQALPLHKRQRIRLKILRAFIGALKALFGEFSLWCDHVRMMLNVNSQVKVLEGYLRCKYNAPSIKIETFTNEGLLMVGLKGEGLTYMPQIGQQGENKGVQVSLEGEIREGFGEVDFKVYIPAGIDIELIRAEIERYKTATAEHLIIQMP